MRTATLIFLIFPQKSRLSKFRKHHAAQTKIRQEKRDACILSCLEERQKDPYLSSFTAQAYPHVTRLTKKKSQSEKNP